LTRRFLHLFNTTRIPVCGLSDTATATAKDTATDTGTPQRERERASKKRLGLHVRQGKKFEMCIKKNSLKEKSGFLFCFGGCLDTCKNRKKLAN
jgi:hypothetical protein